MRCRRLYRIGVKNLLTADYRNMARIAKNLVKDKVMVKFFHATRVCLRSATLRPSCLAIEAALQ